MNTLRILAVLSFVVGLAMLVVGFVASGSEAEDETRPAQFDIEATPTPTPVTATSTPRPGDTPTPTPTPTPPPYDGAVARLKIPRFGVDAAIENIGLLPTNVLDVPKDPANVGWYEIYDKPGFGGNAVFSAHVDYWPDIRGPFYNLANLELGDQVIVVMDDGREYVYEVIRGKRYDVYTIPMGDLIEATGKPPGEEWITLITCGGQFVQTSDEGWGEYLERDVVIAKRIQ